MFEFFFIHNPVIFCYPYMVAVAALLELPLHGRPGDLMGERLAVVACRILIPGAVEHLQENLLRLAGSPRAADAFESAALPFNVTVAVAL